MRVNASRKSVKRMKCYQMMINARPMTDLVTPGSITLARDSLGLILVSAALQTSLKNFLGPVLAGAAAVAAAPDVERICV